MRARIVLGLLLLIAVVAAVWLLPVEDWLRFAEHWVERNPVSGRALFVVAFVVGCLVFMPGSVLTLAGGYLFGLAWGVPLVSIATALGAAASCVLSRALARDWLAERYGHSPLFRAIDRAIASNAFLIVLLTRLSLLIPYNVLNLMYGLSRVPVLTLTAATWLGMLPAVTLYVYVGSLARNVDELLSGELATGTAGAVLLAAGLVTIVLATVMIHRAATRALKRELENVS